MAAGDKRYGPGTLQFCMTDKTDAASFVESVGPENVGKEASSNLETWFKGFNKDRRVRTEMARRAVESLFAKAPGKPVPLLDVCRAYGELAERETDKDRVRIPHLSIWRQIEKELPYPHPGRNRKVRSENQDALVSVFARLSVVDERVFDDVLEENARTQEPLAQDSWSSSMTIIELERQMDMAHVADMSDRLDKADKQLKLQEIEHQKKIKLLELELQKNNEMRELEKRYAERELGIVSSQTDELKRLLVGDGELIVDSAGGPLPDVADHIDDK